MPAEKAILVGVELEKEALPVEHSLEELGRLAVTAGASVEGRIIQKRPSPDPRYFIGSGKVEEIKRLADEKKANIVIFDSAISPSQQRNIEEALDIKVVDRTQLILDIFALHAHTHEGKLQVELAQDEYMLTRLTGKGIDMSRLGGGIRTRGPGETKLETDRRNIRKRVSLLKKEIEAYRRSRQTRRSSRTSGNVHNVSLVGYTNSGKSTLMNALTKSNVLSKDMLFATLDTTTRRMHLEGSGTVLLSDTVGFISKLPHQLVDAFRATLEEVCEADLLLHVVDLSSDYMQAQIDSVYSILEEIGAIKKPMITVFNKSDKKVHHEIDELLKRYQPAIEVSALKNEGLSSLRDLISSCLLQLQKA